MENWPQHKIFDEYFLSILKLMDDYGSDKIIVSQLLTIENEQLGCHKKVTIERLAAI